MEERDLVQRCCAGERAALDEFISHFWPIVEHAVRQAFQANKGRNYFQEVEDVCQQVFLKILQKKARVLRNFKWRSTLNTYLSMIASYTTVDFLRKNGRWKQFRDMTNLPADLSCREDTDLSTLHDALNQLIPRDKLIIELSYERNWSYEQIGRLLNLSVNAVGPAISRAMGRLRKKFQDLGALK